MELMSFESFRLKEFIQTSSEEFESRLLTEAGNVKHKIEEILTIGNIDLVNNAHKLVAFIIEGKENDLVQFAKQEGIAWATHAIPLSFKLEWVHAMRRTLWSFIQDYHLATNNQNSKDFFHLEQQVNNQVDQFLNTFFISYSTYKESLINAHRELVEKLSVPIIPINPLVCILPLIGSMDSTRTAILEEKVLSEIGKLGMQTLIIDLSGIADMEPDVIHHLRRIIDSCIMMGCQTVITGLRPEVVRKIVHLGISFDQQTKTLGTLQQALKVYLK